MKLKLPGLVRPSTLAFYRAARRTKNFSWIDFLHGYIYGRWIYFYIAVGTGRHPLAKAIAPVAGRLIEFFARRSSAGSADRPPMAEVLADTYHGKVMPLEAVKELVMVREDIRLPDLEPIVPYDRARDIVLENPQHIVVIDCPCRAASAQPCLPLDVCLIVGEPFASFIIEHQPERSRWITSEEALAILKAEDERGHVHHAFFKDAMLGRFYAICNCCACCCGALKAHHNAMPMLASSGFVAAVDEDLCLGCDQCREFCQFNALAPGENGLAQVDAARCMGCGVCVNHCPNQALSLQRDPSRGEPLEIFKLMQAATRI